jgi:hypothetical protein
MHAPATPNISGSTGTGKTSHHGRAAPRHMHAPHGTIMGGSLSTGKTSLDGSPPR